MKISFGQLSEIISLLYNCEIEDEDVYDVDTLCEWLDEHGNKFIEIKSA